MTCERCTLGLLFSNYHFPKVTPFYKITTNPTLTYHESRHMLNETVCQYFMFYYEIGKIGRKKNVYVCLWGEEGLDLRLSRNKEKARNVWCSGAVSIVPVNNITRKG
jgi:hypothetical protein